MGRGIEKSRKGFFKDNEGIFLISSNYLEKQQIEDGLNREITRISNIDELIRAFTEVSTSINYVRANVIITSEIPLEIKAGLGDVVDLLETTEVPVFEVGVGKTVKNAYRFGEIKDFIDFARNNRRKERIKGVKDNEQRNILEELQLETEIKDEKIKELKNEKEELEKSLEEVQGKYDTMETKVKNVYEIKLEDAEDEVRSLKEDIEDLEQKNKIEVKKSEQYRIDKDKSLNELTDLKLSEASLKEMLRRKRSEVKQLERKIERKNDMIDKLNKEKEDILNTRVDSEDHVLLSKELDKERNENEKLKSDVVNYEIKLREYKYLEEELRDEIDDLRKGNYNIETIGRTSKLDKYKFEKTDLVYIKVFEELPYFKLATKFLFEQLSEIKGGRSHLMILKHDDGMDSDIFEGIPLWSKIKDVPAEDRIFRLFPNPSMFTKADEWSKRVDLMVVVDYIQNNEYYLTTQSKERYMTVVRRDYDIKKYDLKGSPITIEGNSIYPIKYDTQITRSGMRRNRHQMVRNKVKKWVKDIYS